MIWAWNLLLSIAYNDELYLADCGTCRSRYVQDAYALDSGRCPSCAIDDARRPRAAEDQRMR